MMAMLLAEVALNPGNATIGGSGFWWQYYRGGRQMMSMQRKELSVGSHEFVRGYRACSRGKIIQFCAFVFFVF